LKEAPSVSREARSVGVFHLWIVALDAKKRPKDGLHAAAGLLELQRNPDNASEIWLKNIGTREDVRQRGVASGLIEEMVRVLMEMPEPDLVLARSRASEDGEAYLKKKIDDALDLAGIAWTQGERHQSIKVKLSP